jgi:hypothetical protein
VVAPIVSETDSYGSVSEAKRSRAALSARQQIFLVEHVPDPVNHRIRNQVSGAPARMPPAAGFGVNVRVSNLFFFYSCVPWCGSAGRRCCPFAKKETLKKREERVSNLALERSNEDRVTLRAHSESKR